MKDKKKDDSDSDDDYDDIMTIFEVILYLILYSWNLYPIYYYYHHYKLQLFNKDEKSAQIPMIIKDEIFPDPLKYYLGVYIIFYILYLYI